LKRISTLGVHDYQVLRIKQTPEIEVYIVPSSEDPSGVGELGAMLAPPAVVNAVFAATGVRVMTFREFLDACKAATRSEAQFIWIPQDFLHQHGLETDFTLKLFAGNFPLWRPVGAMPGLWQVSSEKAFRAGWQTRTFQETALDCLAYFRSRGQTLDWEDYLSPDKEKQVLDAWEHRSL